MTTKRATVGDEEEAENIKRWLMVWLIVFSIVLVWYMRRVTRLEAELSALTIARKAEYSYEEMRQRARAEYREDIARGVAEGVQPIVHALTTEHA